MLRVLVLPSPIELLEPLVRVATSSAPTLKMEAYVRFCGPDEIDVGI
jgi:hypothetical protein